MKFKPILTQICIELIIINLIYKLFKKFKLRNFIKPFVATGINIGNLIMLLFNTNFPILILIILYLYIIFIKIMNDQYFFKIKQIYLCYNLILKKIIIYDKLSKILKKTKCITYIYNKINNINENIISFKKNFYLEYNEIYIIKIIENSIKKINKIKKIIIYKLFYFFLKYEKKK